MFPDLGARRPSNIKPHIASVGELCFGVEGVARAHARARSRIRVVDRLQARTDRGE